MSFDSFLLQLKKKWSEVPAGSDMDGRRSSGDFLTMPERQLLTTWTGLCQAAEELRGWYWRLYAPQLKGAKVLEVGSGLGFDAIPLSEAGARWTCCDIVPSNLATIDRVARARGLDIRVHQIDSLASFEALDTDFDFVWCNGSLIHLPFEDAREECAEILRHLKPGGRWVELAYPRERWVREGHLAFDRWGRSTDGDLTPWAEWYDIEKLKRRLAPHLMLPLLDQRFCSDSFVWFDLVHTGRILGDVRDPLTILEGGPVITTPPALWNHAYDHAIGRTDLGRHVTVEVICRVEAGSPGIVLAEGGDRFIARELILEARTGEQVVHLRTDMFGADTRLSVRNASALGRSRLEILRVAAAPSL